MKKIFAALFVTIMMAAGLVGATGSGASAAPDCPYTGCVRTSTHVGAPDKVKKGSRAEICMKVTSDGNGRPQGQATVRVVRGNGGYKFIDSKSYDGQKTCFRTTKLKKTGKYVVKAIFDREPGSSYKDSDNRTTFKVTKRG